MGEREGDLVRGERDPAGLEVSGEDGGRDAPVEVSLEDVVTELQTSGVIDRRLQSRHLQSQSRVSSSRVREELLALVLRPPDQPVPEAGVEQHDGVVSPGHEDPRQGLEGQEELLPGLGLLHVEAGH